MEGGTTFVFVTDGIESAIAQARGAAGDKDVQIHGGGTAVQQALAAGLLDELQIHYAPVLLGSGFPLLGGTAGAAGARARARVAERRGAREVQRAQVTHARLVLLLRCRLAYGETGGIHARGRGPQRAPHRRGRGAAARRRPERRDGRGGRGGGRLARDGLPPLPDARGADRGDAGARLRSLRAGARRVPARRGQRRRGAAPARARRGSRWPSATRPRSSPSRRGWPRTANAASASSAPRSSR